MVVERLGESSGSKQCNAGQCGQVIKRNVMLSSKCVVNLSKRPAYVGAVRSILLGYSQAVVVIGATFEVADTGDPPPAQVA